MKCVDKVAYNTRGEAWDFVKTFRKSAKHKGGAYIYECKFCGKWHVTHYKPERFRVKTAMQCKTKYNFKRVSE